MTTTIPFPHPGETLQEDFLVPLGMSANALAIALAVPPMRINLIVRGQRAVTADTALRLARYFGSTPQFWLNLQAEYDLRQAQSTVGAQVERQVHPRTRAGKAADTRRHPSPRQGRARTRR